MLLLLCVKFYKPQMFLFYYEVFKIETRLISTHRIQKLQSVTLHITEVWLGIIASLISSVSQDGQKLDRGA